MHTHRCFVPDANGPLVHLPDVEAHHVRHVLRLSEGDRLHVFDGRGREWLARIVKVDRRCVDVEVMSPATPVAEPPVAVTVAVGVVKGDQMSAVVRDVTALGAARIVPVGSSHVVVAGSARQATLTARLARVAAASAAQCGRAVVPPVDPVTAFDDLLEADRSELRLIAVEPRHAGEPAGWTDSPRPASALLLVGPEGGWTQDEVSRARAAGCRPLNLGPRVLRAEVAPTVALAALWTRWGW